ncbi:RNA methyltransferase [Candidatus Micrarchaeota archaeon]|nr:RNA methyltransferase [Candidatus Micrarchaeota archaeon]
MKIFVVVVEPEYGINLGMIARVMKNFGKGNLRIVNPKCDTRLPFLMYAKHAADVVKKTRTFGSLKDAVLDMDSVIGTTAVRKRHRNIIRTVEKLEEFKKESWKYNGKKVAIVFGREGIGLNSEELKLCDRLITIGTSKSYGVLNLSHAVAIVLYELAKKGGETGKYPGMGNPEKQALENIFKSIVDKIDIRKKEKVVSSFKNVLGRAVPTNEEGKSLLCLFRGILEGKDE